MMFLFSAIAFFVLITGLILIHELGHFLVARASGVVVEEFGFGLPPRVKTLFTWMGTQFSFNWIPFGGFVRLKGENALEEDERRAPGSFSSVHSFKRVAILVAGVAMNFLLAIAIFLFGFSYGRWIPTYLSLDTMEEASARGEIHLQLGVLIEDTLAGGTAHEAGIPAKSVLLTVDGQQVTRAEQVLELQQNKQKVVYTVLWGPDQKEEKEVTVAVQDGKTGMYLQTFPRELSAPSRGIEQAMLLSLREARTVTVQTVFGLAHLIKSLTQTGRVPEGITGIVGIAQLTHTSIQEGFMVYLRLVALLSLSLAVLNILPFPALDGGRLLFVIGEIIFRRSHRRIELIVNTIGFFFLLLLILLVTFYDVLRLFT